MAKAKAVIRDGKLVWLTEEPPAKEGWLESPPMLADAYSELHPHVSQGLACHKSQVGQFNKDLEERGLAGQAHYNRRGEFVSSTRHARNEELKRRGLLDADGGYGDHTGYHS